VLCQPRQQELLRHPFQRGVRVRAPPPPGRHGGALEGGRFAVKDKDWAHAVVQEAQDAAQEAQQVRVADHLAGALVAHRLRWA